MLTTSLIKGSHCGKILKIYIRINKGPWCIIGDFNNVLYTQDIIGGKDVTEIEYADLETMMKNTNLFEMDSKWDYSTWSNRQVSGTIYYTIVRYIGNVEWFQQNTEKNIHILALGIPDHVLLWIIEDVPKPPTKAKFKFLNSVIIMEGFTHEVLHNLRGLINGRAM